MARSTARKRALNTLYEADEKGQEILSLLAERIAQPGAQTPLPDYAVEIVRGVADHRRIIDRALDDHSTGWKVRRMPVVDRNILRIAAWEMLYNSEVPDKVAIDEALSLARSLSDDESLSFIHGLLSAITQDKDIYPELEAQMIAQDKAEEEARARAEAAAEAMSEAQEEERTLTEAQNEAQAEVDRGFTQDEAAWSDWEVPQLPDVSSRIDDADPDHDDIGHHDALHDDIDENPTPDTSPLPITSADDMNHVGEMHDADAESDADAAQDRKDTGGVDTPSGDESSTMVTTQP
jgi:N utilization substance protein B